MKKESMPYGVYHLLTCVLAVVMAVLAVLVSQRAEEKWYLKLDVSPSGVTNLSDYTPACMSWMRTCCSTRCTHPAMTAPSVTL